MQIVGTNPYLSDSDNNEWLLPFHIQYGRVHRKAKPCCFLECRVGGGWRPPMDEKNARVQKHM